MENLSRSEVIALFALGFAILGTLAAAWAIQKTLVRLLLILLTFALSVTFVVYIAKSLSDGKSSRELSKEELVQQAKRALVEEQARRDEAVNEAWKELERKRAERESAERAVKDSLDRDKAQQDARDTIAREDALKGSGANPKAH